MEIEFPRLTVSNPASFTGLGLHTGQPTTVMIHSGESGIWFRSGSTRVRACPEEVTDTQRCTVVGHIFATVEHVLSALAGHGVTDAEIELTGPEFPALDGASAEYFAQIHPVPCGNITVDGLFARVYHSEEQLKIAIGRGDGQWKYVYDVGSRWPGRQAFECHLSPERYAREIAPARTFALEEELPMIKQFGLARGLDETSALVLGSAGFVNQAKFADEPARHKLLDLVGDLSLAGVPICCLNVVAERSGHRSNVEAAKKLAAAVRVTRVGPR